MPTPADVVREHASTTSSVAARPLPSVRPPLSGMRIAGEAWLSFVVGGLGAAAGAGIADKLDSSYGDGHDTGHLLEAGYAAYVLSVPLGAYWASTYGDQAGSLSRGYLGAVIGGASGVLAVWAVDKTGSDSAAIWGPTIGVAIAAPIAGAIIGANLGRKYDDRTRSSATVVPVLSIRREHSVIGIAGRL